MRGTKSENIKNAAIAILMGVVVALLFDYPNTVNQIIAGYLVSQIFWVFMTCYDEIQRKRRAIKRRRYCK